VAHRLDPAPAQFQDEGGREKLIDAPLRVQDTLRLVRESAPAAHMLQTI